MGEDLIFGVPLAALVLALVEWIKSLGVTGKWINVAAMLVGLAVGLMYKLAQLPALPATFAGWFEVVMFGLLLGLAASGAYKYTRRLAALAGNTIELAPGVSRSDDP